MRQFKFFSLFLFLLVFQLGLGQDTTAPTLSSLTHDHDDLVLNGNETVIITATFSENMISSPTISIGGDENDIDRESMTATSSSRCA